MTDVESALREVFADRAGALDPPAGVYAAVRRRHVRRQRSVLAAAVVLVLVAVGVPAVLLRDRPAAPTARTLGCGAPAAPAPEVPGLAAQPSAPGSLGGDRELIQAAQRTAWATMTAGDSRLARLDPRTIRVGLLERVAGQVVGVVTGTDRRRTRIDVVYVTGPGVGDLTSSVGPGRSSATPRPGPFPDGDVLVGSVLVCGDPYGVVVAPAGSTGRLSWVTGITPAGTADRVEAAVPLRADGTAVFRRPAPSVAVRVRHGDRVTAQVLPSGGTAWVPDRELLRDAVATTPLSGGADPEVVAQILATQPDVLPVPQSDLRVLWAGRTPGGLTVAVAATHLPSGADYVWAGSSARYEMPQGDWSGLVPAGALERTVLAWRPKDRPGAPLAVFAPGAVSVFLAPGGSLLPLSGGGAVLPDVGRVSYVTLTGPTGPLGRQVPGRGLLAVPPA